MFLTLGITCLPTPFKAKMPASSVLHALITMGGILSWSTASPQQPTNTPKTIKTSVPTHEIVPASAGGSATLKLLSDFPTAMWDDFSSIPGSVISLLSTMTTLFTSSISSATASMITLTMPVIMTSFVAISSYFKAMNSPFFKVRPWMLPMMSPPKFLQAYCVTYTRGGPQFFETASSIVQKALAAVELIVNDKTFSSFNAMYDKINPDHISPNHLETYHIITQNWDIFSRYDGMKSFLNQFVEKVEYTSDEDLKKAVKGRYFQLVTELKHLYHLLDKSVSSICRPQGINFAANITKPFRAGICPSNHNAEIRFYKVVFQLMLCIVLHEKFNALQNAFISRQPKDSTYLSALNALNALNVLSLPSSTDDSTSGGSGIAPPIPSRPTGESSA